ncbi:MAG TPA: cytochrome c peroxidase [Rubricoccaceae bacterium]
MPRLIALVLAASLAVLGAFTARLPGGTPVLPATPLDYTPTLPGHLTAPGVLAEDNTPAANPTTDDGATLGRVLFYDTRLSSNLTIACASCHRQADGFSDPAPRSAGFGGGQTARHSMSLSFARYYPNGRYFWDERAATLEDQVLMPIQDGTEMGMTLPEVTARLQATAFYPDLFARAFGTPDITPERTARALAQFVRSIVPTGSRYDAARVASPAGPPGQPLTGLTAQENQGLQIFFGRGQCNRCHGGDAFVATQARNNGLDATVTDIGAGGGRFKVGSLRNVALSAPFMHDGRFATLEQVVDFYDDNVRTSANLDPILRGPNGQARRLGLSPADKAALVAFLRTLSDPGLATDARWSDPFTGATAAEGTGAAPGLALAAAGPNPFRGRTALYLTLPETTDVSVVVFDAAGRRVGVLAEGRRGAGETTLVWDAAGLPAGRYTVRAVSGGQAATHALTLLR